MPDRTILTLNYILDQYKVVGARMLSAPKLTKLIYICDWRCALRYRKQVSDILWEVRFTGIEPDLDSLKKIESINQNSKTKNQLPNIEKNIIDQVLLEFKKFDILELKNYADSTYPSTSQMTLGSQIDLASIAKQYEEHQKIKRQKIQEEIAYRDEQIDRIQ